MAPFASFRYHALTTSSFPASLPFSTQQKHKAGRSDSIRSKGFGKDLEWNVRRLQRLSRLVLVVAAQPEVRLTFLVPPHRRPVE
jgi:hypothetical protein